MKDNQPVQQQVSLIVPEKVRNGIYTNAASVTVGQREVIIDFGFIQPNIDPVQIEVVSRLIMSNDTARSVVSAFENAILDFERQQKKLRKAHDE